MNYRTLKSLKQIGLLLLSIGTIIHPNLSSAAGPLSGTVELDGEVTSSGTGPNKDYGKRYNGKTKVTVTYTIVVKEEGGKKKFDYSKSTAKFKDSRHAQWNTLNIPITKVEGDPCKGTVTGFTVKGTKWYPNIPFGYVDKGIQGSFTLDEKNPKKGKGTIKSAYSFGSGGSKTVLTYTFVAPGVKKNPEAKGGKKATSKPSSGQKVAYQADSGVLSFDYGTISELPDFADLLLDGTILLPDFEFRGFTADGTTAIFWTLDNAPMIIEKDGEILQYANVPVLFYSVDGNTFTGAVEHATFADEEGETCPTLPEYSLVTSTFLVDVANMLDEDPTLDLTITIVPEEDLMTLTSGFESSAITGGTVSEFVADPFVPLRNWLQPPTVLTPLEPTLVEPEIIFLHDKITLEPGDSISLSPLVAKFGREPAMVTRPIERAPKLLIDRGFSPLN